MERGRYFFSSSSIPATADRGNLEYRLLGTSNKETRVAHVSDGSDYSTGSNDAVAGLKLRNRLLQFSLPFLLRPD